MTVTPPEPPSHRTLGFDEFIAILVAFLTLGTIFFWVLGRANRTFNFAVLPSSPTTETSPDPFVLPSSEPSPDPSATITPEPPASPPASLTPVPSRTVVPVPVPVSPASPPVSEEPSVEPSPTAQAGVAVSPSPSDTPFTDIPADYWALPFITVLSQQGIITGFEDGTFRPNQPVTRAEFASMLQKAFAQAPTQRSATAFKDVPADFWAQPAIAQAYSTGFMEGYPNGNFQPTQEIPRFQALISLVRGLGLATANNPADVLTVYEDANQIPGYGSDRVAIATENGLVVNYPEANQLAPTREATRAEVAAFIYQALVKAGRLQPVNSEYVIQP